MGWQLCTSFHYVSKELKMVVLLKFVMFSTFLSRRLGEILNSLFLLTLLLHYVLIMFIIKKYCQWNNFFIADIVVAYFVGIFALKLKRSSN